MDKRKPNNGENLNSRPWISIADELPKDRQCVEFASHQYYGLANWSKEKGFHEVFLTSGPWEEAEYFKDCAAWNGEVMWWRPICKWPYYGERGCDADTMKDYEKD
jgi:hypothetical protein